MTRKRVGMPVEIVKSEEIEVRGEQMVIVAGLPLRLSFEPDAIIEHFECDEDWNETVENLSREQIATVGLIALTDDRLYEVFHQVLKDAVETVTTGK